MHGYNSDVNLIQLIDMKQGKEKKKKVRHFETEDPQLIRCGFKLSSIFNENQIRCR